ncbi:hypothetical protein ACT4VW_06575 [Acinetobacter baumannii]
MNTLTTILGIAPFSLLVISILKYIFLPHYRFQISQQKLNEKAESIINFYNTTYKSYKNGDQIPQYELQMKTNIAFGKKYFYYKTIFLLFDRDIVFIEKKAKDLMGVSFMLNVDYQNNKITPPTWLTKKSLTWFFIIPFAIYAILSTVLILSITISKNMFFNSGWFITLVLFLLFINLVIIMNAGRLKSIKDLIDW